MVVYSVQFSGVSKIIEEQTILKHIDLELENGKFYTLLGPSGCGKTTILNLIAGFMHPTDGEIYLNGEKVNHLPANQRQVNTVFQDYSLFPHMNVYDNVAFGLKVRGLDKRTIAEKVRQALSLVRLEGFEERQIQEMSGGQRQRVAIARAIVNEPDVLLLDEPLSALDMKLRSAMQYELRELQRRLGITFLFVTHDQEEALALSDWIFVMNDGEIVQSGTPQDIYDEPINAYVANFIGASNIIPAEMKADYLVAFQGGVFECLDAGIPPKESVQVLIRPEDIILSPERGQVSAQVENILFKGVFNEIIARDAAGYDWKIHTTRNFDVGEQLNLTIEPDAIHVMRFNESEEDFDARIEQYSLEVSDE